MTHQLAPVGRQLFPAIFPMAAFHRIRHNPAENVWNIILQEYSKENSQEVKMESMKNTPCPHLGRVQSWHRGYCADLLLLLHAANWQLTLAYLKYITLGSTTFLLPMTQLSSLIVAFPSLTNWLT